MNKKQLALNNWLFACLVFNSLVLIMHGFQMDNLRQSTQKEYDELSKVVYDHLKQHATMDAKRKPLLPLPSANGDKVAIN